jgi:uncharacterized protein YkwD
MNRLDLHQVAKLCLLIATALLSGQTAARADLASDFSTDVFTETNLARQANGLPVLRRDTRLDAAATGWAQVIEAANTLEHELPGHPTVAQRIAAQGYHFQIFGENLAYGYPTAHEVVGAWLNSPGHRANLLNPNFRDLGVGAPVRDTPVGPEIWVAQDFGLEQGGGGGGGGGLVLSGNSLAFGTVKVNSTATRTFTITNRSTRAMAVVVGALAAPYRVSAGGGSFSLGAGTSRTVQVQFAPRGKVTFRSSLAVSTTSPTRTTASVAVSGAGG